MPPGLLSTICPIPPFPSYTNNSSDKDMTASFADFAATQDARNTVQLNIRKYTLMLCDALEDNFKSRNRGVVAGRPAPEYKLRSRLVVSITRS